MNWKNTLEQRWNVKGWTQILLIILVFAITGSTSLKIGNFFMSYFGFADITEWFIRLPIRILFVTFSYQVLLLIFGTIFGQFQFFWAFEKKMWGRFIPKSKN